MILNILMKEEMELKPLLMLTSVMVISGSRRSFSATAIRLVFKYL